MSELRALASRIEEPASGIQWPSTSSSPLTRVLLFLSLYSSGALRMRPSPGVIRVFIEWPSTSSSALTRVLLFLSLYSSGALRIRPSPGVIRVFLEWPSTSSSALTRVLLFLSLYSSGVLRAFGITGLLCPRRWSGGATGGDTGDQ